jgi:transcriptional regulator with XRE-family HTH domain
MKPQSIDRFDFSAMAGIDCVLLDVPGWRCPKCGNATLHGTTINIMLNLLAAELVQLEHRVDGAAARYLRKHLGYSQKDLADKMGIARETVANWERGEKIISPEHDYILRGLVIRGLDHILQGNSVQKETKRLKDELGLSVKTIEPLSRVREEAPPKKRRPIVMPSIGSLLARMKKLDDASYAYRGDRHQVSRRRASALGIFRGWFNDA